jgi:hypothetical protein
MSGAPHRQSERSKAFDYSIISIARINKCFQSSLQDDSAYQVALLQPNMTLLYPAHQRDHFVVRFCSGYRCDFGEGQLLGLDAGTIAEPGLYLVDRPVIYQARELRAANGSLVPLNSFYFRASANEVGLVYTGKLSWGATFLTIAAGAPVARLKLSVPDVFQSDVDEFGLSDFYIQPVGLGWRHAHSEMVTSYGIYIPTGRSALAGGKGLSSGEITHEFSLGGSQYFRDRILFLTALASYQLYTKQRGIDVTRGDMVQVQGGAGIKLLKQLVETGVASYALWQVRDHRGWDCHLCFVLHAIESTELDPRWRWLFRPSADNFACVTSGTSVCKRGRKVTSLLPTLIS